MSVKRYVITQTGVRILDQKEAREYDVSNRFVNEEDYAAKCLDLESSRDTVTALEAEVARLRELMTEAYEFWCHYSSLNEGSQDDMNDERHEMLEKMRPGQPTGNP